MRRLLAGVAVFLVAALECGGALAVTFGQIDTFESGTTEGWIVGIGPGGGVHPSPPQAVDSGGPNGAGDGYLRLTAVGGIGLGTEPGSRLVAINASQWAGDYTGAGITGIAMDLVNLGTSDLSIRLLFEDPIPGPPQNIAVTNTAALLPAGSGWTHFLFPIEAGDLTAIIGDPATVLANTTVLRILHAPSTTPANPTLSPATPIVGMLGVDNIAAVPLPSSLLLAASGLLALAVSGRRRTRR